jgi:hypothetical protein
MICVPLARRTRVGDINYKEPGLAGAHGASAAPVLFYCLAEWETGLRTEKERGRDESRPYNRVERNQ